MRLVRTLPLGLVAVLSCFSFHFHLRAEEPLPEIYPPTQSTISDSTTKPLAKPDHPPLKSTVILPLNEDEKPPERKFYQVKQGDTLWKISKSLGIPVAEIKRLNGLKGDLIQTGQHLILEDNPLEIRRAVAVEQVAPVQEVKVAPPSVSFKERFLIEIRKIIADRVQYNESWTPEGSRQSWVMDCSNTTRFLFHKIFKIDIGRTASDQYYRLKVKGLAWDVPLDSNGRPDIDYLHAHLKEGDLLFWEHTYSPDREPPITHVTVYVGTDEEGRFLMVGSEQGKGLLDTRFNGPDLYYFNPLAQKGGHHQFLFFGWKPGRFVAYGRPLAGIK